MTGLENHTTRIATSVVSNLIILITIFLVVIIGNDALRTPPSFDGAMNLQVSYSLSQGEGYRRTYADRTAFPREVQTNAPFALPAAAAYKLVGVGKWQSQITNFLYLIALVLAAWLLFRRNLGVFPASAVAFAIVITPGIKDSGMNGYGEVPALFWGYASLLAFFWSPKDRTLFQVSLSGLLLAFAACTKTVLLICFLFFGLCYVVAISLDKRLSVRQRLAQLGVLAFCSTAPLMLVELWRFSSLGGLQGYSSWWAVELDAIGKQAGTAPGYKDTGNVLQKLYVHSSLLTKMYGLNSFAVIVWLLALPVALIVPFLGKAERSRHAVLVCLAGGAAIYFAWWLMITPTQKAWHRRILDGSILLNSVWIYLLTLSYKGLNKESSKWVPLAGILAAIWGMAQFLVMFFSSNESTGNSVYFDRAVSLLTEAPEKATIYGIGWHSSPAISLLSKRHLADFNDIPASSRDYTKPAYLVMDTAALSTKKRTLLDATHTLAPLIPENNQAQVFLISPKNWETISTSNNDNDLKSFVDMGNPDIVLPGYYSVDSRGTRWMRSLSFATIRYDGSPNLLLWAYVPSLDSYMRPGGISISARINACSLGTQHVERSGNVTLSFPLPQDCALPTGSPVTIELTTNNLFRSSITKDERELSLVARGLGFSRGCNGKAACESLLMTQRVVSARSSATKPPVIRLQGIDRPLCSETDLSSATIAWQIPENEASGWKILVETPNSAPKLWMSLSNRTDMNRTGEWVRPGTRFMLVDGDETSRSELVINQAKCH